MNNTSAGPPSNAARVRGASRPSESSLKRKRGMFQKDLQRMMYGFGDVINPIPETVALVEDIVVDYVTDMKKHAFGPTILAFNLCRRAHKAQDIATKRGKLLTEDFLFLIRKDSAKLNRCRELLSMHEDLKKARKAFEFDQEELAHLREGEGEVMMLLENAKLSGHHRTSIQFTNTGVNSCFSLLSSSTIDG